MNKYLCNLIKYVGDECIVFYNKLKYIRIDNFLIVFLKVSILKSYDIII